MRSTMADAPASAHPVLPDLRPRMAKASVRKADAQGFRVLVGAAIQRAASHVGWSLKELAGKVDRDPRQVSRWLAGTDRPHFDALFAVEELRQPLVIAIAELAGAAVEIETVVHVKRVVGR